RYEPVPQTLESAFRGSPRLRSGQALGLPVLLLDCSPQTQGHRRFALMHLPGRPACWGLDQSAKVSAAPANAHAHLPAHAGDTVMTRETVYRVAGQVQQIVRGWCLSQIDSRPLFRSAMDFKFWKGLLQLFRSFSGHLGLKQIEGTKPFQGNQFLHPIVRY